MLRVRAVPVWLMLGAATTSAQTPVTPTTVQPTTVKPTPVNPAPVNPAPINPAPVNLMPVPQPVINPTTPQTTPVVPPPDTPPGPGVANPFSIKLTTPTGVSSDFALAHRLPGNVVDLGAQFFAANGSSIPQPAGCVPEFQIDDQYAPDGAARGIFQANPAAVITNEGHRCTGACRILYQSFGSFTVSVHCAGAPQISSVGNDQPMNFKTDNAGPLAGGGGGGLPPIQPIVPGAAFHLGGPLLGAAAGVGAALAIEGAVLVAQDAGGGGGGGGGTMYCFAILTSTAASCPVGKHCAATLADCQVNLQDTMNLCSGMPTFSGCSQQAARGAPPVPALRPIRSVHELVAYGLAAQPHRVDVRRARASSDVGSHGSPSMEPALLDAALAVAAIATTSYVVWRALHPARGVDVQPWMQPSGGGMTIGGAF